MLSIISLVVAALAAAVCNAAPPPPPPYPTGSPPHPKPLHANHSLPSSFEWTSTDILIAPKNDSRQVAGVKDPSIIFYKGHYHVFTSTASEAAGYSLLYLNFTDFNKANSAPFYYLDQSAIGTGYRAAPEVFYFEPHKLWYLIYQNGNAAYSTNPDISNPAGWSAPGTFYNDTPALITANLPGGYWVDMWVICDKVNCHLFSSDDNGHLYRSQTSLANFPNNMTEPVVAMEDLDNKYALYEASNVYHVGNGKYLLIIEAIGSDGRRYFRSWTSTDIAGPWAALADTEDNPFASNKNVKFTGTPWTQDISHGEAIRTQVDQTLSLDPCKLRYLYQGEAPAANTTYNQLPWRLALLTQTNSAC